jgi:hypothetical protein
MPTTRATARLRPIRIGFLVDPSDLPSILQVIRINTCLWGGLFNPIIPLFEDTSQRWLEGSLMRGLDFAKGYLRFFAGCRGGSTRWHGRFFRMEGFGAGVARASPNIPQRVRKSR